MDTELGDHQQDQINTDVDAAPNSSFALHVAAEQMPRQPTYGPLETYINGETHLWNNL